MKVLVTGAAGFAGHHVLKAMAEHHEVVGVDLPHRLWAIPKEIPAYPCIELHRIAPVDIVVNLAATADPRLALKDPAAAYVNSVRVMVDTLEYARRVEARVLHVSTNEVYGHRDGPVYAPQGPYAGAKACQEIVCAASDVPTTVVVTQSLFGERQQPNKLVPTAVRKILAGEPVPLQRDGVQWAARPFMHARNLAEALVYLAERSSPGRVHVGADRVWSVRDVVDTLADALGLESDAIPVPAGGRAGHELDAVPIGCDIRGWRPPYPTIQALRDVACWYKENPDALADSHSAYAAPARQARPVT